MLLGYLLSYCVAVSIAAHYSFARHASCTEICHFFLYVCVSRFSTRSMLVLRQLNDQCGSMLIHQREILCDAVFAHICIKKSMPTHGFKRFVPCQVKAFRESSFFFDFSRCFFLSSETDTCCTYVKYYIRRPTEILQIFAVNVFIQLAIGRVHLTVRHSCDYINMV